MCPSWRVDKQILIQRIRRAKDKYEIAGIMLEAILDASERDTSSSSSMQSGEWVWISRKSPDAAL